MIFQRFFTSKTITFCFIYAWKRGMSKWIFGTNYTYNNIGNSNVYIKIDIPNANDLLSLFIRFDFIFSKLHGDRKLHVNLNTLQTCVTHANTHHILTRGKFCVIWTLVWFRSKSNSTKKPLPRRTKRGEKQRRKKTKRKWIRKSNVYYD